ncbi:MAG TPA: four helix bundle protein [Acidimicrobiia bacterium]|nr:four helix bundle protein [Acidimicrobiia bacterium]
MRDLSKSAVLAASRRLLKPIYGLVRELPEFERYGLAAQLRRAAISITANIAEGLGRGTEGDFERHLRIASGSAAEVEALLDAAVVLDFVSEEQTHQIREDLRVLRARLYRLTTRVSAAR